MRSRIIIFAFCLLGLGGCSQTPDLQQWSQNSALLKESVSQISNDVLQKTDDALEALENGRTNENWDVFSEDRMATWQKRRTKLAEANAQIDAGMTAMLVYAESLSNLAASGETGQAAADAVFDSLNAIKKTLGSLYPDGIIGSEGFRALTSEISSIATKVKAQGELSQGMKQAQGNVDALAQSLKNTSFALIQLIGPTATVQEAAVLGKYGRNRIAFYQQQNSYEQIEKLFAENDEEKLASTLRSLENIAQHYRAYQNEISSIRQWRDTRQQQLESISAALDAWVQAHAQAQAYLERCGGFKSLRGQCGNFTAANLIDAQNRIENLRSLR